MSRAERESLVSLRLWLVSRSARSAPLIASPKPAAEAETVAPRCSECARALGGVRGSVVLTSAAYFSQSVATCVRSCRA